MKKSVLLYKHVTLSGGPDQQQHQRRSCGSGSTLFYNCRNSFLIPSDISIIGHCLRSCREPIFGSRLSSPSYAGLKSRVPFIKYRNINFGRTCTSYIVKRDGEPFFLKTPTNITVVWRRLDEDYPLTIGDTTFSTMGMAIDHAQLSKTSSSWDLLIKNTQRHHAGVYECQVTANHLIAQYVTLNVLEREKLKADFVPQSRGHFEYESPTEMRPNFGEYAEATNSGIKIKPTDMSIVGTKYVNLGSRLHLSCNATGVTRAPESIDWFYEGIKIDENDPQWRKRVQISKTRSIAGKYFITDLIVEQSEMSDMGTYLCRSSDLKVNSLKVFVLNDPADVVKIKRNEDQARGGEIKSLSGNRGSCVTLSQMTVLLNVLIAVHLHMAMVLR